MNANVMNDSQVLVCQRGARHRYAVPMLLEREGMLSALYTDSCAYSGLGRTARVLVGLGFKQRCLRALAARDPREIDRERIYSSDVLRLPRFMGGRPSLATVFQKRGLGSANIIYSMYGEEPDFIEWSKAQGAKIIVDVFVHPATNRIVADEEMRCLGEHANPVIDQEDSHSRRVFALADRLLCPSGWVADGVREFAPDCASKIRIVPYGNSVNTSGIKNDPVVGSILFAGREPLRKGLHYLAEAGSLLRKDGVEVDLRVAGVSSEEVQWMEHASELNCLGSIPLDKMKEEYARTDVFVLPSLSEGQAGVLLEAMASGCAVVATRESGVDFEPGCGVDVPVRNARALADELKKIIEDRAYRDQLASGAVHQAAMFSLDSWKQRLIEVVGELADES